MEIIPEGKNFRLVQDNELPELLLVLEQYMPEAVKFHQTIKTYLNEKVWKFYFYVSKNWPEEPVCLHFPGCTYTPNQNIYESIGIFCPEKKIQLLDLLQAEDVLVDWAEPLYLNFTHIAIMKYLESFYTTTGSTEMILGDIYVCRAPPDRLELDSLPSDEVEMRPLLHENAKAIHDLYPASEIEGVEIFEKLIDKIPGFGIYTISNNELAAWMVQSYYGAMFSMQTRPEFRRKGYGIHLAQSLTELVLERGYLPFVVIRPENDASRSLYTKLGFEKAFETARWTFRPIEHEIDENSIKDTKEISENSQNEILNDKKIAPQNGHCNDVKE